MERVLLISMLVMFALAVGCGSDYDGSAEDRAYEAGYFGGDEPSGDIQRDTFDLGRFDSECDDLKRRGEIGEWGRRGRKD